MKRKPLIGAFVLAAAALLSWGCALLAGRHVTEVNATPPIDFPETGFSHASFEGLLRTYVGPEGGVNYEAWHADRDAVAELDSYLAAIALYSPDATPQRFPGANDAFVYWVHAYNAFVIKAVLDRWPLESVTDVTATIEITRGFGFFYGLEFVAGGTRTNLYDLEHDKLIRDDVDARVHFVLNCGSGGCPVLRPDLPTDDELEPVLAAAARDFVADPQNVSIDPDARVLRISTIFEWYEDDFLNDLRRRGLAADRGILDYLIHIAPPKLRDELERAATYDVEYIDYDWSVNAFERDG